MSCPNCKYVRTDETTPACKNCNYFPTYLEYIKTYSCHEDVDCYSRSRCNVFSAYGGSEILYENLKIKDVDSMYRKLIPTNLHERQFINKRIAKSCRIYRKKTNKFLSYVYKNKYKDYIHKIISNKNKFLDKISSYKKFFKNNSIYILCNFYKKVKKFIKRYNLKISPYPDWEIVKKYNLDTLLDEYKNVESSNIRKYINKKSYNNILAYCESRSTTYITYYDYIYHMFKKILIYFNKNNCNNIDEETVFLFHTDIIKYGGHYNINDVDLIYHALIGNPI